MKITIAGISDYSIGLSCILYALKSEIIVFGHNKRIIAALKTNNYIMTEPHINKLLQMTDIRFTTFASDAYKDTDMVAFIFAAIGKDELLKWTREALMSITKETIFIFEGINAVKEANRVREVLKDCKYKIHFIYLENTYHKNQIISDIVQPKQLTIGYANKSDIALVKKTLKMQCKNGTELIFFDLKKANNFVDM